MGNISLAIFFPPRCITKQQQKHFERVESSVEKNDVFKKRKLYCQSLTNPVDRISGYTEYDLFYIVRCDNAKVSVLVGACFFSVLCTFFHHISLVNDFVCIIFFSTLFHFFLCHFRAQSNVLNCENIYILSILCNRLACWKKQQLKNEIFA